MLRLVKLSSPDGVAVSLLSGMMSNATRGSLSLLNNNHINANLHQQQTGMKKVFFSSTSIETIDGESDVPKAFLDYLSPPTDRPNKPNVLIKGASLGAITLALALQKRNIQVTVLDKREQFRSADPGVFLPINATLLLNSLNPSKRFESQAHIIANKIITDENGATKHKLDLEIGKGKGQHNLSIDSRALLSTLVSKARAIGVDILPGVSPAAWTRCDDGRIKVHFNNDRVPLKYDVVVAADGIDSKIRKKEFEDFSNISTPKVVCYRAVIDREHTSVPLDSIIEMRGKGAMLVLNPYSATKVLVSFYESDDRAPLYVNSQGTREVTELTKKIAKNFNASFLTSVIGRLNVLDECKLIVPQQLQTIRWVNGRVVLLGNAAHTMYPYFGQNDALEIEDAFSLAVNLDKHENVDTALSSYFAQRATRVMAIQLRAKDHFEKLLEKGEEKQKGRVGQFFSSVREKIPLKNPLERRRAGKEYQQLKQTWEELVFHTMNLDHVSVQRASSSKA